MGNNMPRPRKYDYKKDLPIRMRIFVNLPVEYANELEEKGYGKKELSELVEKYLVEFVENNRKKD